jgi:DNA-binding transcriptional LysR family regulator
MLKQFRTLVVIADAGSFQDAARQLGVTQSAVSMQMKSLETQLQVSLFDRTVRPPRLNRAGRLMLERVREVLRLSEALTETAPAVSHFEGSIMLGTIPGASFVLPEALYRLNQTYPRLQIRVSSSLTHELRSAVHAQRLDAALVTLPRTVGRRLSARSVLREPLMVLAPLACAGQSDVELLQQNRYISYNRKAQVSKLIEATMSARRIRVAPIMELDTLETFQQMIVKGLGVGILPASSIRAHLRDSLYVVPFGVPPIYRELALLQRMRHPQHQLLDALYETFCEVADEATC